MTIRVDFSNTKKPAPPSSIAWSDEQQAIFSWFEDGTGNLIIRARAGTGKTTTILEGVNRAPEQKILLAAFNKSIATELSARLRNPRVEAKTLHGLGFAFLRRVWTGVNVERNPGQRAEALARRALVNAPDPIVRLVKNLHSKVREMHPFASSDDVRDIAVRFDLLPEQEWIDEGWTVDRCVKATLDAMTFAQERTSEIDFADMIFLPIVLKMIRPWYNMVVVDEAQDMTTAQLILAVGACKRGGRVAVVGDDRQAIYAFRGADAESLDRLKHELRAAELGLKTTYRCPKSVVTLAQTLVPDFRVGASAPEGLIKTVTDAVMLENVQEGDFILSRTNAPMIKVCMTLLKAGRRARIKGRDIGKGIIALIRRQKAQNVIDLLDSIQLWAKQEVAKASKLGDAADTRVEFIRDQADLVAALSENVATIEEVIARCDALFADDAERGAVMLSSVHRAKGLEAARVYLLQGTFRQGKIEEDNIRYVGITRAKNELYWVTGFESR